MNLERMCKTQLLAARRLDGGNTRKIN